MGGGTPTDAPTDQIDPNAWLRVVNQGSGFCVDGSPVRTDACGSSAAQRFRFRWLDGPYLRIDNGGRSLGWTADGIQATRFDGSDNPMGFFRFFFSFLSNISQILRTRRWRARRHAPV
ncbi:RICIN domain-containing protein [Kutzneria sp. 744]|uniref:RICIN domain-containing protein n=1 Tax=Kutzneria sp. (strain 744) TaxID=345341 RepID=UPI0004B46C4B|nr:hypothetical protein [Kutzneria sp. 744]